jgi:hypothetical protein
MGDMLCNYGLLEHISLAYSGTSEPRPLGSDRGDSREGCRTPFPRDERMKNALDDVSQSCAVATASRREDEA